MKKRWVFISLIFTLILLLVFSNPQKDNYVEWVNDKAQQMTDHPTQKVLDQLLLPKEVYKKTARINLGIFSIYKTIVHEKEEMMTLGVFNNFIVLYHSY